MSQTKTYQGLLLVICVIALCLQLSFAKDSQANSNSEAIKHLNEETIQPNNQSLFNTSMDEISMEEGEKTESDQEVNRKKLNEILQVATFLNSTRGHFVQSFKGTWSTKDNITQLSKFFTSDHGMAVLVFELQSFDSPSPNSSSNATQFTKQINNNTVSTQLDIVINLLNSQYLDEAIIIRAVFKLSYPYEAKTIIVNQTNKEINFTQFDSFIYETQMLTIESTRGCNLEAVVKVEKFVNQTSSPDKIVLKINNEVDNSTVYKVSFDIMNTQENNTCFPRIVHGEFSNMEHSDLEFRLYVYCTFYIFITILQIFITEYEYCKMQDLRSDSTQHISLTSLCLHSIWNLLSIIIHIIFANQFFTNHTGKIFALKAALIILHFISQRRIIVYVWKAQQRYFLIDIDARNNTMRCYIRYYFIAVVIMISIFKILSIDFLLISFFGLIWVPQIIQNLSINLASRYKFSPCFLIITSLHLLFFPTYIRGCPKNIFHTKPHLQAIILLYIIHAIQIVIIYLQLQRRPLNYLPTSLRRKVRKFLRSRALNLRGRNQSYQYYRKFPEGIPIAVADEPNQVSDSATIDNTEEIQSEQLDDCIICLTNLRNEPCEVNADGSINETEEIQYCKGYMQTPCNHKFHKKCLQRWMMMKLECPTCRTAIPAFDRHNDDMWNESDDQSEDSDLEVENQQHEEVNN